MSDSDMLSLKHMKFFTYIVSHRNDKISYIGWTSKPLEVRWKRHVTLSRAKIVKAYFHRALNCHGKNAFDWHMLEEHTSASEAKESEIFWIAYLRSLGAVLYNRTRGGDGLVNPTIDVLEKMRLRGLERVPTSYTRDKIRASMLGKTNSLGTKRTVAQRRLMSISCAGDRSHLSLLTWKQVRFIRASTLKNVELAHLYQVTKSAISLIRRFKTWKFDPESENETWHSCDNPKV